MTYNLQDNIFFEENNTNVQHQDINLLNDSVDCLPYLQRGDSSKYIDQFILKEQQKSQTARPKLIEIKKDSSQSSSHEQYLSQNHSKINTSSFHNFQKHLTVCLKHSIKIKQESETSKDYQIAGSKLWKIFKISKFSTKKILHYLLGDSNEHKITSNGWIEYGFHKVVSIYDEKTIRSARNYLKEQTLRQINEGKVNEYIRSKRLKDKQKFEKYVQFFKEQLEQGFLRKRLPKDKVFQLQRL